MLEGMSDMELKLKGGDGKSGMNLFKLEMRAVGPLKALRLPSCPTACNMFLVTESLFDCGIPTLCIPAARDCVAW
jgi:hypothetical protein